MKDQRKTNLKVGITFLISILLIIFIISWAKNFSFSDSHKIIKVAFNSVSGLNTNDIVTVNGVKKGYVEKITLHQNISYVDIKLDNDVILTEGTKFYVMMLDLMGGKKIEIIPGNSTMPINYGQIQKGEFSGDVSTAMAFVGTMQENVNELLSKLNLTLDNLNNSILNKNFTVKANSLLTNANSTINSLNGILKENQKTLKELIQNGNETLITANDLMNSNKGKIDSLLTNINFVLGKSNNLISSLDSLADQTIERKNNLGKLLYDEKLVDELKQTVTSVKELTKMLVEQMKAKGIKVDAYIF